MHSATAPGGISSTRWASPQVSQARIASCAMAVRPSACKVGSCSYGLRRMGIVRPSPGDPLMRTFLALAVLLFLTGCGYNTLQQQDEQVKAAWSEVINQYQRRADLIPNLVNTVKGFAQQEQT